MRALDLFAGPGGWSQACRALHIDELGIEIDPTTCATAKAAGHLRMCADVRRIDPREWSRADEGLIASPPCQTFSRMGSGSGSRDLARILAAVPQVADGVPIDEALGPPDFEPSWDADGLLFGMPAALDPRTALVLEPLRYVREIRPEWVALEQVPDVLPIWRAYGDALAAMGYASVSGILHAESYGVPQTRTRAVLVARLHGPVRLPPPTHSRYHGSELELDEGLAPWVSMAAALGEADGWHVNDQSGTPRDRLWPSKRPATTIAGRDLVPDPGPNANRFNGSTKSRNDGIRVTAAQAGILQGFPPDYPWHGTKSEQHRQIGDAIPPALALAVLREVV
jgi:DNA (cytosine-5)-methyltransferase 1